MDAHCDGDFTERKNYPPDFSIRVDTEENQFGSKVLVVISMLNGEIKKDWMTAFEAPDFVLRNPALGSAFARLILKIEV